MIEPNRWNIETTMSVAKMAKTPTKGAVEQVDVRAIDPVQKWWLDA